MSSNGLYGDFMHPVIILAHIVMPSGFGLCSSVYLRGSLEWKPRVAGVGAMECPFGASMVAQRVGMLSSGAVLDKKPGRGAARDAQVERGLRRGTTMLIRVSYTGTVG